MKPVAYVYYAVGGRPHFIPVINESVTFKCSALKALEYEPLYTANQLRAAQVAILRKARERMSVTSRNPLILLDHMADELEHSPSIL